MNESKHHEDLVQVLRTATEFEAHTKKVVLLDAGIEATVISHGASWAGMIKLSRTEFGAAVWVKQEDLEAAQKTLAQVVADSVDLDWDEVDVGEFEDDIEVSSHHGMPVPARFAWAVAVFMMLLFLMLAITLLLS